VNMLVGIYRFYVTSLIGYNYVSAVIMFYHVNCYPYIHIYYKQKHPFCDEVLFKEGKTCLTLAKMWTCVGVSTRTYFWLYQLHNS